MASSIALGFYQNSRTAQIVLQKLKKAGFYRSASIQHTHENNILITTQNQSWFLLGITILLLAILCGFLFTLILDYTLINPWLDALISLGCFAAVCTSFLFMPRIDQDLLTHYKSLVIRDETLVIAQVKPHQVREVLALLRDVESGHPISFLLRPELYKLKGEEKQLPKDPVTQENLEERADKLAHEQHKVTQKTHNEILLNRLNQNAKDLKNIHHDVAEAEHIEQTITPSAEWLLDNTYIIQASIDEVQRNLPQKYYSELPKLLEGPNAGLPRAYIIADEIIKATAGKLNKESIISFLNSYQKTSPLTMGELWVMPLMLKLCLIEYIHSLAMNIERHLREGELASFWGNRLLNVARREPHRLASFLRFLNIEQQEPSGHFAEELWDHLFDEDVVLIKIREWIEKKFKLSVAEIVHQEQINTTTEQITFSNAIVSLIAFAQFSWREIFEIVSPVDAILNNDPANTYSRMNFDTRDAYRHAIEAIAKLAGSSQTSIAQQTINMAAAGDDEVTRHIGYYLIDAGRKELEHRVHCNPSTLQKISRSILNYPTTTYLGGIFLVTAALSALVFYLTYSWMDHLGHTTLLTVLSLLPMSELAIQIINLFLAKILKPLILPKMSFKEGIPEENSALIVMPMMLLTPDAIKGHVERLEIHYLANTDKQLHFGLISDFSDAPQKHMNEDDALLDIAVKGIDRLEKLYGTGKFFLFHRDRVWSESEQAWIGWERKRGKLECLNEFLVDKHCDHGILLKVGNVDSLQNIRFVITLDADTQLPKDRGCQLIETISHPLNAPQLSVDGKSLRRGYTLIQPRVEPYFSGENETLFSKLFSDPSGIDPYTRVISDVYQDLAREGTYHGKGIYDVKAFHSILSKRFPEAHLLSHDLLEGAYVRVGFASDVVLFDTFPTNYFSWAKRQHRWIRGDWQIIDWLWPYVPVNDNNLKKNPIDAINRWKIFDNLRRSLMPLSFVLLLLAGWTLTLMPGFWGLLVLFVIFMPTISLFLFNLYMHPKETLYSWRQSLSDIVRTLINISLLPQQAFLGLDAICRVIYRRCVSHHKLLEWAVEKNGGSYNKLYHRFILRVARTSLFALFVGFLIASTSPHALIYAMPFLILWFLAPAIVFIIDKPLYKPAIALLSSEDKAQLHQYARHTWRFFDDFVGPQTHWLPPDNYQAALEIEVAQRTSPTNIGLWLVSVLTAYDLKYITCDDVIDTCKESIDTLKKLERYEGHLLNWYDIQTLDPLHPRYVSTVDSGNLIASFWTLEQGLYQLQTSAILPLTALEGAQIAYTILSPYIKQNQDPTLQRYITEIGLIIFKKTTNLKELIEAIHASRKLAEELINYILPSQSIEPHIYWIKQIHKHLEKFAFLIERYFGWVNVLCSISQEQLNQINENAEGWRNAILSCNPSMQEIASGPLTFLKPFVELNRSNFSSAASVWFDQLLAAATSAQWLAEEKIAQCKTLISDLTSMANGTNMAFLYNKDRKVFTIGYNVNNRRLDNSYYDLLASEARIASLVSIAKGDAPIEHWWALGRPYSLAYGRWVLLSWGGTMFEYLMPLLFNKQYKHSLLGNACEAAVECQIDYGKNRGIPWGISESAFSEIDNRKIYQYRSFGVPGIGLKRGLEYDLVVSPYSSALALAVQPKKAIQNLNILARGFKAHKQFKFQNSLFNSYGYYESIDFTRQHGPHGERGVIVYAYMAHHQGMSLIAMNNILNENIMPQRFHNDPRISGIESLLYEKIPLSHTIAATGYRKEIPVSRITAVATTPIMGNVDTPNTAAPHISLLSNGKYSLMVTNSGGGYSRWQELDITRWRSDTTMDLWGSFCYIKNLKTGAYWSTTYQPTLNKGREYSVNFKPDRVEFRRRDGQFETLTEVVVSPEDNAEIRLITLANLSDQTQHLELTSYSELALAPHMADLTHPCFNKLFIQTEALPQLAGLLASRRLRAPDEKPIWVAHVCATSQTVEESCQYETSRSLFIGRGRSLQDPAALDETLSNTVGTVLDPIFSLRRRLVIEPGQRVQIAFVTAVGNTREEAIKFIEKYNNLANCHRALEMAWTHAQLELRHLRIQQEELQLFQKLASRILYPHAQLRASASRLQKNLLGQSALWAYGISGDVPILVVTIADTHDIDLVKQVLIAHAFWRLRGLKVDLIIFNEQASGYENPLLQQLQRMIQIYAPYSDIEKPGGIFLRTTDQVKEEDLTLILCCARAILIAARGSLRQQLVSPMQSTTYPARLYANRLTKEHPSPALPFMELSFFNGIGGFTKDGHEYVIYLTKNLSTPAPWINVIANENFGVLVSENGLGTTWYGNSQTNRLTPWSNDPVLDPITDAIYIRDNNSGIYWTPTPAPIRENDDYRICHGQGYTRFFHNSHGIEQALLVFVPVDDAGGLPVRIQKLILTNRSSKKRNLCLMSYTELVLGPNREDMQLQVITEWDAESQALFAYNHYNPDYPDQIAFISSIPAPSSFTGDRTEFLGRNGSLAAPAALKRTMLSGITGPALDPCAALHINVDLNPGEHTEVSFIIGYAPNRETARKLIFQCREQGKIDALYAATLSWWNNKLNVIQVEVPDQATCFSMNRWLLYQTLSCRIWGRTAFYQASGAYGFRDQLQDVLAMLYTAPYLSRAQILLAASRQFVEGDVQHWWHPPNGGGVRTKISDDLLWLIFVTAQYIRVTGDVSILNEEQSFLQGDLLAEDQHEAYFVPQVSQERATILEHCRRAMQKATTSGAHGLPLIGGGDWNDGMNRVGIKGKGESVWLAWFLIQTMNDLAEMLEKTEQTNAGEGFRIQAKRLAAIVEDKAWDGNWYRRAYYDDGAPLGSKTSNEAKIDSISQSWAEICGAADPARAAIALKSTEEYLVNHESKLVLLLNPAFDKTQEDPGYIKGYPPGVRENGGQYTHGSLWFPMAVSRSGDGEKSVKLLQMMLPINHTLNYEATQQYKGEPYVMAGDVYALPGQMGRAGWTWYSGSSAWMYRIWLEEVLGFTLRGKKLTINPKIPSGWRSFAIHYRYLNTTYHIHVENPERLTPGKTVITLDGTILPDSAILLTDDSKEHHVHIIIHQENP